MTTAKKKQTVSVAINFDIDLAGIDADDRAEALSKVALGLEELAEAARRILRGTGIHNERAHSYWLGRLALMLDSGADSGCDGIYGTMRDLTEGDEDEDEDLS
jgi:hypothetical protein